MFSRTHTEICIHLQRTEIILHGFNVIIKERLLFHALILVAIEHPALIHKLHLLKVDTYFNEILGNM